MRNHLGKKFSAILISLMLVVTGSSLVGTSSTHAAQPRGEVNFNGPLRYPTPKSLGLGSGWTVQVVINAQGNYASKSCRIATKCIALGWASKKNQGSFFTAAFRSSKSQVKAYVSFMKSDAHQQGARLKVTRKGKAVTYTLIEKTSVGTATKILTVFNGTRIGQVLAAIPRNASKSVKKNTSAKKLVMTSNYLANPANGRVLKTELVPN